MTKFAILFAGILLCSTLLTGCGSQQPVSSEDTDTSLQEDSLPQYNARYQADGDAPPAVRERPHLSSDLLEDYDEITKN